MIRINEIKVQKIEIGYLVQLAELTRNYGGPDMVTPTEEYYAENFQRVCSIMSDLSPRLKSLRECRDDVTNR
jgi:hypothetical protein